MKVREVLKLLRKNGWYVVRQTGSHIQLRHYEKKGLVTVPGHGGDLDIKTLNSIFKQAGLK